MLGKPRLGTETPVIKNVKIILDFLMGLGTSSTTPSKHQPNRFVYEGSWC
jgi:hypothetical protein